MSEPLAPVAIARVTRYPCGCVARYHIARERTGDVTLVRTLSGPCSVRRADWTGADFARHDRALTLARPCEAPEVCSDPASPVQCGACAGVA